jgi:hypothetical protein
MRDLTIKTGNFCAEYLRDAKVTTSALKQKYIIAGIGRRKTSVADCVSIQGPGKAVCKRAVWSRYYWGSLMAV